VRWPRSATGLARPLRPLSRPWRNPRRDPEDRYGTRRAVASVTSRRTSRLLDADRPARVLTIPLFQSAGLQASQTAVYSSRSDFTGIRMGRCSATGSSMAMTSEVRHETGSPVVPSGKFQFVGIATATSTACSSRTPIAGFPQRRGQTRARKLCRIARIAPPANRDPGVQPESEAADGGVHHPSP
jgi:hypothetical protein